MDYRDHISFNPRVCHGQACIKGTRVLVSVVLDSLAAGMGADEVLESFPSLTQDDVSAALGYAKVAGCRAEMTP